MPPAPLQVGQVLRGRFGQYTLSKMIYQGVVWLARDQSDELTVVKSVIAHPRVENERDVLRRFQGRSKYIRPLIDEIQDPVEPVTIVLKHLEDDLLSSSVQKRPNRKEIKYLSRGVLEALSVLHEEGFVHTDVKPNNVFVNYKKDDSDMRFSEVQLGDFGGSLSQESKWAKSGTPIGAPIWNSPEVLMELPWNTATDIWSFGTLVISLIFGGDFNLFYPKTARYGDEDFNAEVIQSQFRYFGPFPEKIKELVDEETLNCTILGIMHLNPPERLTNFSRVVDPEVLQEDKDFILKIMKMDWRDRPTAKELLADEWFSKD